MFSVKFYTIWKGSGSFAFLLLLHLCSAMYLQIGDKCQENSVPHLSNDSAFYDESVNNESYVEKGNNVSISNLSNFTWESVNTQVCDPGVKLECLAGRCQCKKGYTMNRNGTKCLEVARNGLESSCEENIQCWKSLLGRMSECNLATGKCQCYESESLPIVFHQGRCYYGEGLGEYCQIEGLCEATTPNATCRSGGICQCKEGNVPSWDKSRCLPIATDGLNSFCEENIQCEQSQMGALSECNQETMKCNCYKIPDMDTVFHGGKCYLEASLGDVCQVSAQCQKKTLNSLCSKNGKCICDDGNIPNGNNTLCLPAIPSSDGIITSPSFSTSSSSLPSTSSTTSTTTTTSISNINNNIIPLGAEVSGNGHNNNNTHHGECQEDSHCLRKMGPYSRCNPKHKCECFLADNFPFRLHSNSNNNQENIISSSTGVVATARTTTTTAPILSKHIFLKMDGLNELEQLELMDHVNPPSLVMVGLKCYLGKYLGQRCKFNKQCMAMTEYSLCDGRCVCMDETHVESEDGRKCLPVARKGLDSGCDEDAQCQKSELGPLSRCNGERKRCECANNVMPIVYFKGKCHFHRQLGSSCEAHVECQAGSNYLAECSMGRCRCQNGTVRLSQHNCGFKAIGNNADRREISKLGIILNAIALLLGLVLPLKM